MTLIKQQIALIAVLGLLGTSLAFHAKAADSTVSGTAMISAEDRLVVASDSGIQVFEIDATTDRPESPVTGQPVIVRYRTAGDTRVADEILVVDDALTIAETGEALHFAVSGSVQATGADQLILQTLDGRQAFVIRPSVVRSRPLDPGTHAAVIYRVEEHPGQNRFIATDIVPLPADAVTSPVLVRYSPVDPQAAKRLASSEPRADSPKPPPSAETSVQVGPPRPQPSSALAETGPRTARTLPRTASSGPLFLILGLGALLLAATTRRIS